MNFSEEYDKLVSKFTRERNLDLDDQTWPSKDYSDFTLEYEKLFNAYREQEKLRSEAKADEQYDEEFYLIQMIVDTEDGADYETIDVRSLSLEKLSDLCTLFPNYYSYYFKKVKESL
jgi:hypothetical protein